MCEAMSDVPSIKGSVFSVLVENVSKLIASGDLSMEELARRVEPGDLAYFKREVLVSQWYDIRAYDRLNTLLLEVEGRGDTEYLREQGRETARHLMEQGLYTQLSYVSRAEVSEQTDPEARFEAFGRDLRLLTSLSNSILNFTTWKSRPDPDRPLRYVIEVTDARDMPESLCWRSDGFINGMAERHGRGDLWKWSRPRRDLVRFQMLRDA